MRCGGEEGRRVKNDWEDFHGCVLEERGGGADKARKDRYECVVKEFKRLKNSTMGTF